MNVGYYYGLNDDIYSTYRTRADVSIPTVLANIAGDIQSIVELVPGSPRQVRWSLGRNDTSPLTYIFDSELQAVMFVLEFKRLRGEA